MILPHPFRFWLRKILVNTAIDYYRANQKYPRFLELKTTGDVATEELPLPEIGPETDVLPILQQLSPVYRMVFNLYIMEEYKHDEIAEMLDISSSASRSNLGPGKKTSWRELMMKDEKYKHRFLSGKVTEHY